MNKLRFCLLLAACCLLLSHCSFATEEVSVTQIEAVRSLGYDYINIFTDNFAEAKGLLLEDKLYIDIPHARLSKDLKIIKAPKSKRVLSIRAVQKDSKTARVIITLKREIEYDIANIFGRGKSVVEIADRPVDINKYQFAWEAKNKRKRTGPLKVVKLEPPATGKKLSLRGKIVVLDPGHGGDDPGAFAVGGTAEKKLTLEIARTTAKLLRQAGATVYLTRDEDRRSGLEDITEFANKSGADIFISIHYNSMYTPEISGTETYYFNPISRGFAEKMHEAIVRGIKRKDHGLHRTPFFVVKNTNMPAVLIEPVYLSNPEESNLARSSDFQEELAGDIVKGVKEYFRNKSG
jgi:N-acetylmuramoyl-L-alanine amidase